MDVSQAPPQRLLLLDGNALLHRAFHALPPLTTLDGKPAGAVYGFISMILKLQIDLHPTFYAVAFDRPKPTFRKELLATYQAQRPPMDEALVSQIGLIHEVLEAFKIPMFEVDGFEADDVIGTLVSKISVLSSRFSAASLSVVGQSVTDQLKTDKPGAENRKPKTDNRIENKIDQVIIVTGDRDILQLVEDEKVLVYMPVKGLSEAKLYGEKEVVERLGVPPDRIPDWKALAGDSSDNYHGVVGIGPKTAAGMVMTYGTTEALYQAVEKTPSQFSAKVLEKLVAGKEHAQLSKTLATIRLDVPLEVEWEKLQVESFNTESVKEELLRLGFSSLLKRVQGGQGERNHPTSLKLRGARENRNPSTPLRARKKKIGENSDQMNLF